MRLEKVPSSAGTYAESLHARMHVRITHFKRYDANHIFERSSLKFRRHNSQPRRRIFPYLPIRRIPLRDPDKDPWEFMKSFAGNFPAPFRERIQ